MIRDNFQSSVYYQNNTKYINILDEDNIPTLGQFYYWFNKEYGIQEVTIAKYGRKKFERDYRPVLGSSSLRFLDQDLDIKLMQLLLMYI